jgi:hypothetical protein
MPLFDGAMEFALAKMGLISVNWEAPWCSFYIPAEPYDMTEGLDFFLPFSGGDKQN